MKCFANVEPLPSSCQEEDSPVLSGIISTCLSEIEEMRNVGLISSIQLNLSKKTMVSSTLSNRGIYNQAQTSMQTSISAQ